jgi:hypothetical protein
VISEANETLEMAKYSHWLLKCFPELVMQCKRIHIGPIQIGCLGFVGNI